MAVSRKGQIDMTIGHIMKNIILFAIPIIIGNVLQQLLTVNRIFFFLNLL